LNGKFASESVNVITNPTTNNLYFEIHHPTQYSKWKTHSSALGRKVRPQAAVFIMQNKFPLPAGNGIK